MLLSWMLIIAFCSLGATDAKRKEAASGLSDARTKENGHDEYGEYLYDSEDEEKSDDSNVNYKEGAVAGKILHQRHHYGQGPGKSPGQSQGQRKGQRKGQHQAKNQGYHERQHQRDSLKSKRTGIEQDFKDTFKTRINSLRTEIHQAMQPAPPPVQNLSALLSKILENQNKQSLKQSQQASESDDFKRAIHEALSQLNKQQKQKRRENISEGDENFKRVCEENPALGWSDDDWKLICKFLDQLNMKLREFLMDPDKVVDLIEDISGQPSKPSNCKCGLAKRSSKEFGGSKTEVNEYPWHVAIAAPEVTLDGTRYNFPYCGGALISKEWVLTSAICQFGYPKEYGRIWLGEHDLSTETESRRLERTIKRVVIHPNFNKTGFEDHDLALIKLSSPVDFEETSYVRPICLPEKIGEEYQDYADFTSVSTGWGPLRNYVSDVSLTLQEQDVQVLSQSACRDILDNYPDYEGPLLRSHLCPKRRAEECIKGDFGGPLITAGEGDGVTPGQNYELIGVYSRVPKDCSSIFPGLYTRVTELLGWIRRKTGDLDTCPRE